MRDNKMILVLSVQCYDTECGLILLKERTIAQGIYRVSLSQIDTFLAPSFKSTQLNYMSIIDVIWLYSLPLIGIKLTA